MKKRTWKCDVKGCSEIAEWYRIKDGVPLKLCIHHFAEFGRKRFGKPVDLSELSGDDLDWLVEKDQEEEATK